MSAEIEQVLLIRKVKATSIYKLLFYGLLLSFIPLGMVYGISGFFGADTVNWNNQPIHGTAALFAGPALAVSMALFLTVVLGTLTSLGLWMLSYFRTISIRVVLAQSTAQGYATPQSGSCK